MSGLCHVHFTSGLEILKNVVVYHHWDGTETLSEPADKDEIVYSMETCTLGFPFQIFFSEMLFKSSHLSFSSSRASL